MNTFEQITEDFLSANGWTQADLEHMRSKKTRALRESIEFFAQYGDGREAWRDAMLATLKAPTPQVANVVKREKLSSEKSEKKALDVEPERFKGAETLARIRERLAESGQDVMRNELAVYVSRALRGRENLPPILLTGPAGTGKTTALERYIAPVLEPEGWKLVKVSPASTLFTFNNLICRYCHSLFDAKVIFFIDEIHALDASVQTALQLYTNGMYRGDLEIKTGRLKGIHPITVDPRRHWFIAASNVFNEDKGRKRNLALFGPSGRFLELEFTPLQTEEDKAACLSRILAAPGAPEILQGMSDAAKLAAVGYCLPFPRSILRFADKLSVRAEQDGIVIKTASQAASYARKAGFYPGGLSADHVSLLCYTGKSAKGKTPEEMQSELRLKPKDCVSIIQDLIWKKFLSLNGAHYILTKEGAAFIKSLSEKARK